MKYGLIGEHLPHSFSKEIHAKIAPYTYELHELKKEEVEGFMEAHDFMGINVTIPYKQTVIPFLDEIDDMAQRIGAVNTIVNRDGKLYGYNTDFYGMKALIERLKLDLNGTKVLILGTGGTSKTANAVADSLGAKAILTVGRSAKDGVISYETAYAEHTDADFIINTTPCGMYPYPDGKEDMAGTPIDLAKFPNVKGVIDAVYNPIRTNLVMDAKERGIPAEGGLYMLVAQAIKAAEYFMDTKLDDALYERIYTEILASKENIVLTGMPGSGKSTVGKALAEVMGREFIDTDAEIVKKAGKEITDIFAEVGNDGFRKIEAEVVTEIANQKGGAIIATGGGAILRDDNVRALRRAGRVYFLNRPLDKIMPTEDRPLSRNREALEARFKERYSRYLSTCDMELQTDEILSHTISMIQKDFTKKMKILVINGPNLNMLGIREPAHYGKETYADLLKKIEDYAAKKHIDVEFRQSNHEGDLVDYIQSAYRTFDGIVINPGAYTHTSIAILDAVKAVGVPTCEVHISDVNAREDFRKVSYIRAACVLTVSGHGTNGYLEAIDYLIEHKE